MKKFIVFFGFMLPFWTLAQSPVETINKVMDDWHNAAATANEEVFFGTMIEDGIYLGTDKTEKWTRDEMAKWADEYFQKESAWTFTAISRDVYFSEDGNTAWLNEKLDTWMGVCKGTAVLVKKPQGWKIALYDLSITVDNDKIEQFIDLSTEK